jgi:signal transduction histidine kinase
VVTVESSSAGLPPADADPILVRRDVRHEDIARIAHDFKNPLSTIALEADLLEHRLESGDQIGVKRAADRITRNVEFLDRLVMDLLDLCSFEAGRVELRREPTELRALLEHVIERVVPSRDLDRVVLAPSPRQIVQLDDLRIERVVANLIANALKYGPAKSRIDVLLELETTVARVSVRDAGSTLGANEIAYIFDAYRRVDRLSTPEGSGLGLYVSKRIIEAHGGQIGVTSLAAGGTGFFFELPLAPPE